MFIVTINIWAYYMEIYGINIIYLIINDNFDVLFLLVLAYLKGTFVLLF